MTKKKKSLVKVNSPSNREKYDKFAEHYNKIKLTDPNPKDIEKLRKIYDSDPTFFYKHSNSFDTVIYDLIEKLEEKNKIVMEGLRMNVAALKISFGHSNSTPIEKILIEQVILSWLRLQITEMFYNMHAVKGQNSIVIIEHWERRLSYVQKRYLRAIETYSKVKKININIRQLNIASGGNLQVNN